MVFARAQVMDGPRDEFLARAGFAQDKHIGFGGRDGLDLGQDFLDGGAAADDVAEVFPDFVQEKLIFPFEAFLPLETIEGQNRAGDFALIVTVRRRFDMHPMQLAVLPFYLHFKTFRLAQDRMGAGTVRLWRPTVPQETLIPN